MKFFISLLRSLPSPLRFLSLTTMSDIVEIEAFRRNNVGKKVHYKVRALGSNDAWKTCEGVLTDSGVKIYESGYDVFYDFPNEGFEYSSIRAVAEDGAPSYLHPIR